MNPAWGDKRGPVAKDQIDWPKQALTQPGEASGRLPDTKAARLGIAAHATISRGRRQLEHSQERLCSNQKPYYPFLLQCFGTPGKH